MYIKKKRVKKIKINLQHAVDPQCADPSPPQSTKVVVWSGGFDSTALLLHLLHEGHTVNTISVRLRNNDGQQSSELVARRTIGSILRSKFPSKFYESTDTEILQTAVIREGSTCQPILWATNLVIASPYDDVYMGYIKGDDFWHIRADFENIITSANKIMARNIKVHYPFEWHTKKDLLNYFNNHPDILELISACEMGNNWRYCDCDKCKTMLKLYNNFKAMREEPLWSRPIFPSPGLCK